MQYHKRRREELNNGLNTTEQWAKGCSLTCQPSDRRKQDCLSIVRAPAPITRLAGTYPRKEPASQASWCLEQNACAYSYGHTQLRLRSHARRSYVPKAFLVRWGDSKAVIERSTLQSCSRSCPPSPPSPPTGSSAVNDSLGAPGQGRVNR